MRKLAAAAVTVALAATPGAAIASGSHHVPCGRTKPHHTDCGMHKRVRGHQK